MTYNVFSSGTLNPAHFTSLHLFDGEVRAADSSLTRSRIFGVDEFEVERETSVRRQRSAHREQVSRDADPAGKRDEVGRVGQRSVQTFGVALWTEERPSLTLHVAGTSTE